MKYLLFAGPGGVGKTAVIDRTARNLIEQGFSIVDVGASNSRENGGYGLRHHPQHDFYLLLEKDGKLIVVYSWGDNKKMIMRLANYLRELRDRGLEIFLVIMATRDASEGLYSFTYRTLGLNASNTTEIPMGRMVRGQARRAVGMNWYVNSVTNLVETFILPEIL